MKYINKNITIEVSSSYEKKLVLEHLRSLGEKVDMGFSYTSNWRYISFKYSYMEWCLTATRITPDIISAKQFLTGEEVKNIHYEVY